MKLKIFDAELFPEFMNNTYLLIGGNIGDRMAYLQQAIAVIEQRCGKIVQRSGVYSTAAWGKKDQPDFYNQCLHLQTNYAATELMEILLDIEKSLGRIRQEKMGPRVIDIDILLFNDEVIGSATLQIPHPRLAARRFALIPLAEIGGNLLHPVLHQTIDELVIQCTDDLDVHKISA
jgi:2-amino-4-hydroxy-6-hydroxymethyldihydropteridine diphosphokinase